MELIELYIIKDLFTYFKRKKEVIAAFSILSVSMNGTI